MQMRHILLSGIFFLSTSMVLGQRIITDVSKSGTSAATFLEIPIGAPAVGMGSAFVSLASDATALYWNVAGTAELEHNEIVALHSSWLGGTNLDFAGLVFSLGNFGNIGISLTSLSMDDMVVRTVEQPAGTGEFFNASDIAAGLSYSRKLTDRFSIGFTAKYIRQEIWHESASAFAIDVGTIFRTDLFAGMIIGASISNFGAKMELSGRDTRRFGRVDETKLGSNERIPFNVELDSWSLPLLFQFGVSTNVVQNENQRWTVAVDALHPSDDYESVNIGIEYAFQDFLFLRGGYQALFLDNVEGGLSFGAGIKANMLFSNATIKADYAFREMGRLENIHVFSLGVTF